jgi:hypothetical protein
MLTKVDFILRLRRYHSEALAAGLSVRAEEIWKELDRRIQEFCEEGN